MYLVTWNKNLETGVELMDSQHKAMFRAANTFFIKCKMEKNFEAASDYLDFLVNYIMYHFQTEESIHISSEYPLQKQHQALHGMIDFELKKFSVILKDTNYADSVVKEFHKFVTVWIKNHVMIKDVEFAKYYLEHIKNDSL